MGFFDIIKIDRGIHNLLALRAKGVQAPSRLQSMKRAREHKEGRQSFIMINTKTIMRLSWYKKNNLEILLLFDDYWCMKAGLHLHIYLWISINLVSRLMQNGERQQLWWHIDANQISVLQDGKMLDKRTNRRKQKWFNKYIQIIQSGAASVRNVTT